MDWVNWVLCYMRGYLCIYVWLSTLLKFVGIQRDASAVLISEALSDFFNFFFFFGKRQNI